jgi:hypothetical protein
MSFSTSACCCWLVAPRRPRLGSPFSIICRFGDCNCVSSAARGRAGGRRRHPKRDGQTAVVCTVNVAERPAAKEIVLHELCRFDERLLGNRVSRRARGRVWCRRRTLFSAASAPPAGIGATRRFGKQ